MGTNEVFNFKEKVLQNGSNLQNQLNQEIDQEFLISVLLSWGVSPLELINEFSLDRNLVFEVVSRGGIKK
jgi:hypothetical protein